MAKKIFRSLLVGIIVFAIAILAGYVSYVLTYRYQVEKTKERLSSSDWVTATAAYQETEPQTQAVSVDHYIARLENEKISIYTSFAGRESFLYTLDISVKELPAEDLKQLSQGVILKNRQELTAFEEDFTS